MIEEPLPLDNRARMPDTARLMGSEVPEVVDALKTPPLPAAWPAGPAQALLVCLARPLAGLGTARQLEQIWVGLTERIDAGSVLCGYVGPAGPSAGIAGDTQLHFIMDGAPDIASTFAATYAAFVRALSALSSRGVRRIAVLCMGYTAYAPEAIKRAVADANAQLRSAEPLRVAACIIDSAFPDIDDYPDNVSPEGWPLSRFHGPAYGATDCVDTYFFLTSAYPYPPAIVSRRAPVGLRGAAVVAPPYSSGYVANLRRLAQEGRERGIGCLDDDVPGLRNTSDLDLVIPFVSSDIWSEQAVGVWMTAPQFRSAVAGTESVARALVEVARRLGRRILLPIDGSGASFLLGRGIPGLVSATAAAPNSAPAVHVCPYHGLSQNDHARLLGGAELAISRTGGQANATVVLALARTPNLVIDLPAEGYMQSEITSAAITHDITVGDQGVVSSRPKARPLGWRAGWSASPDQLAGLILEILSSPEERQNRASSAADAFEHLFGADGNFFTTLARLLRVRQAGAPPPSKGKGA